MQCSWGFTETAICSNGAVMTGTSLLTCSVELDFCLSRFYSAQVREQRIAVSLSVCLCVCLSASIPRTAGPIFMKLFVQIPCGRGSVLLRRRCDTLCTSGFMDDITYGDARKAQTLTYYH